MRLLVPFTVRNPEVVASVPPWAEWADVSADPDAYRRLLVDKWESSDDLMVLEHDVVCRDDVLEQFESCPRPWCVFGYADMCHDECREAWANMLGCTRFRRELIDAVPDAVTDITEREHQIWTNLCDGIGLNLRAAGFEHHWHRPYVDHHPWGIEENDRRHGRT